MPLVAWSPETQASRAFARAAFVEVKVQAPHTSCARREPCKDHAGRCFLYPSYSIVRELVHPPRTACGVPGREVPESRAGGADRSRTDDIQLAKLALYQLSY